MRIRVYSKFTNRITGDIPFHGTDVIKSASQLNKILAAHLKAIEETPELMVTFKLVNEVNKENK